MQFPYIIITGGTSGIGAILSRHLIKKFNLILIYKSNKERADGLLCSLDKNKEGGRAQALQFDLKNIQNYKELVQKIHQIIGDSNIQSLIHCAGVGQHQPFLATNYGQIEEILNVNLLSPIQLTRHLLKTLMAHKIDRSKIIFIGSIAANNYFRGVTVYSAAKAGLEAFTKSLAAEVDSYGVDVNCLQLGFVETPMTKIFLSREDNKNKISLVSEQQILNSIDYLLQTEVSGTVLTVNKNFLNHRIMNLLDGGKLL